jgi:ribosomal protein S18 acetylase RimI-like enzyme
MKMKVFPSDKADRAPATRSGLFASASLVRRVEAAEAHTLASIVSTPGAAEAWVSPVAGGVALFRSHGSPFNKVVGLGFEPLPDAELAQIEQGYAARRAPAQFEVATYAEPALTNSLIARGYQLTGFEIVLARALDEPLAPSPENVKVRCAEARERERWIEVLVDGGLVPAAGETPPQHDAFDRAAIEGAYKDMSGSAAVVPWLALLDDHIVCGAGLAVHDGIAQLCGAATLPAFRRRGVQNALLTARLTAARANGCELAVVTTQPGSKSQQNAQRVGFSPLYARAIWVRERS